MSISSASGRVTRSSRLFTKSGDINVDMFGGLQETPDILKWAFDFYNYTYRVISTFRTTDVYTRGRSINNSVFDIDVSTDDVYDTLFIKEVKMRVNYDYGVGYQMESLEIYGDICLVVGIERVINFCRVNHDNFKFHIISLQNRWNLDFTNVEAFSHSISYEVDDLSKINFSGKGCRLCVSNMETGINPNESDYQFMQNRFMELVNLKAKLNYWTIEYRFSPANLDILVSLLIFYYQNALKLIMTGKKASSSFMTFSLSSNMNKYSEEEMVEILDALFSRLEELYQNDKSYLTCKKYIKLSVLNNFNSIVLADDFANLSDRIMSHGERLKKYFKDVD